MGLKGKLNKIKRCNLTLPDGKPKKMQMKPKESSEDFWLRVQIEAVKILEKKIEEEMKTEE